MHELVLTSVNIIMNKISLTTNQLNPDGYWHTPISGCASPMPEWVHLFDQNGYDLTLIEQLYSEVNGHAHSEHRNNHHIALKQEWFTQEPAIHGDVINHALILERKALKGEALAQLNNWAKHMPLLHKVTRMRPKWGIDFSMDWADHEGNVFEVFHYEFDSFDYQEIQDLKLELEQKFLRIDWAAAALELLRRKHEWHHLGFFEQSDYRCGFFGLPSEQFKMVIWD